MYFLTESSTGNTIYESIDYSGSDIKLYIGEAPPSTATPYVAITSWSNTATTVAASLVKSITGSSSINEVQTLSFSPDAFDGTYSLTIPARSLTVSSIITGAFTVSGNHGLAVDEPFVITGTTSPVDFANGQTLYVTEIASANKFYANSAITTVSVLTYASTGGGSIYTVTASSQAISARASMSDMQTILEAMPSIGVGNVSVSGVLGRRYRLNFQNAKAQTSLGLATITGSLTPLYGKSATMALTSTTLANAISASASIDAVIEIQVTTGSLIDTQVQQSVTISKDIIP